MPVISNDDDYRRAIYVRSGKIGYEVTRSGEVYSWTYSHHGFVKKLMKQDPNTHGYMRVRLSHDGVKKSYFVHKLVAVNYLRKRPSAMHVIRHIDGNHLNNHADNLKWGTQKENCRDRDKHGKTSRGKKHGAAISTGKRKKGM